MQRPNHPQEKPLSTNIIRKQLGQLFIMGFTGDRVTETSPIAEDIRSEHLGGVILFDRHLATGSTTNNIVSYEQVASLTQSINKISQEYNYKLIF